MGPYGTLKGGGEGGRGKALEFGTNPIAIKSANSRREGNQECGDGGLPTNAAGRSGKRGKKLWRWLGKKVVITA